MNLLFPSNFRPIKSVNFAAQITERETRHDTYCVFVAFVRDQEVVSIRKTDESRK